VLPRSYRLGKGALGGAGMASLQTAILQARLLRESYGTFASAGTASKPDGGRQKRVVSIRQLSGLAKLQRQRFEEEMLAEPIPTVVNPLHQAADEGRPRPRAALGPAASLPPVTDAEFFSVNPIVQRALAGEGASAAVTEKARVKLNPLFVGAGPLPAAFSSTRQAAALQEAISFANALKRPRAELEPRQRVTAQVSRGAPGRNASSLASGGETECLNPLVGEGAAAAPLLGTPTGGQGEGASAPARSLQPTKLPVSRRSEAVMPALTVPHAAAVAAFTRRRRQERQAGSAVLNPLLKEG